MLPHGAGNDVINRTAQNKVTRGSVITAYLTILLLTSAQEFRLD